MAQNSSSPNRGNFSTVYGIVLSLGTVILIIIILLLTDRFVRSRYGVPLLDPLSWANDRAIALQIAHLNHDGVAIGIDEETLDSFPKMLYSQKVCEPFKSAEGKELDEAEDNKCCSICLSDYKESEVVRVIPDCGHMFHMDCIDEWLQRARNMPHLPNFSSSFTALHSSRTRRPSNYYSQYSIMIPSSLFQDETEVLL